MWKGFTVDMPITTTVSYSTCEPHPSRGANCALGAGREFTMRSGESLQSLQKLGDRYQRFSSFAFHSLFRWAAEQAKARELGDVVDFVRDLNLEKEKEHHVTSG